MGFVLSIWDGEIPYIPTAKRAVKQFTPFVRPLLVHQALFVGTVVFVVIRRLYYTPESRLELTSADTWGMVLFAALAFSMTIGGLFAAYQSVRTKPEDPWASVDLNGISC
jgi:cellulose synthase (UDP-forming)